MKYMVEIWVGEVEAANKAEAYEKAIDLLNDLAQCNDGSEVLANATPEVTLIQ